jgi:hypothetical protein
MGESNRGFDNPGNKVILWPTIKTKSNYPMKVTTLSRVSLLLLCITPLLFSCKKDKDEEEALKPPAQRILGTWNIVKETDKLYFYETGVFKDSSVLVITPGDFTADFRTDGKVYFTTKESGGIKRDTVPYELVDETVLLIRHGNFEIVTFTNRQMTTRDYYDDGQSNVEHILEWKK